MSATSKRGIEHVSCRNTDNLFAVLDQRLAEDDSNPNDTVSWETIRAEAQARWNGLK